MVDLDSQWPAGRLASAAADLLTRAATDPVAVRKEAPRTVRQARAADDLGAASTALRALAIAVRELHNVSQAMTYLRQAVRLAEEGGLARLAAQTRLNLAGTLILRGDLTGALREVELARPVLRGVDLGRLRFAHGTILYVQGRLDEALDEYQRALPALRRSKVRLAEEANLLNNRSLIHLSRGALKAAHADLVEAERLFTHLGMGLSAARERQNLGFLASHRGDLPAALAWFDRADEYYHQHDIVDAVGLRDRCEALLACGLVVEARRAADLAVKRLAAERRYGQLAEARLFLSEAALRDGDTATARAQAERAKRAYARQGSPRWVAMARYAEVRAAWRAGERSPALLATARRAADAIHAAGWTVPETDARLIAAQLALDLNRPEIAREELARTRWARRHGPIELRSRAWHGEALARLACGNRRGAEAALRAGMRILEVGRAALGPTELRVHAAAHGEALAQLGLRLALQDRKASRVLAWSERWRAGSLRLQPVRPPKDRQLATLLEDLRQAVREVDAAVPAGHDTRKALRRQAALEVAVQRRARHLAGSGAASAAPPLSAEVLRQRLGERALVEIVESDRTLHAVVLAGGHTSLHELTRLDDVELELNGLRFALRRLAFQHGSRLSLEAAADAASYAAKRLDELLLAPVAQRVGDRPLVLVPTGALHALPWSFLPSCRDRPLTVAPSALFWHRADAATGGTSARVALVAGPGLDGAATEVGALNTRYPAATCLAGDSATTAAAVGALDGADLAHVAAHGHFRADNPLLSSLRLADGPLTVYDLESLRQAPRCLVLPACDSGLSVVSAGDELMGLTAAVFGLGTRTLIASVMPIPDAATFPFMLALHEALAGGLAAADALVRARSTLGDDHDATAVGASFVCFGAG